MTYDFVHSPFQACNGSSREKVRKGSQHTVMTYHWGNQSRYGGGGWGMMIGPSITCAEGTMAEPLPHFSTGD